MKKYIAALLCVILLLSFAACSTQTADEQTDPAEILGAKIVYGKQYYAFRVKQYSTTSTYSKSVTVYDEGVQLAQLLSEATYTPLDEEFSNCWGYRVTFYDKDANAIEPVVFISVDGRLHKEDTHYQIDDPDAILQLLADTVKPTNLDAVTKE